MGFQTEPGATQTKVEPVVVEPMRIQQALLVVGQLRPQEAAAVGEAPLGQIRARMVEQAAHLERTPRAAAELVAFKATHRLLPLQWLAAP